MRRFLVVVAVAATGSMGLWLGLGNAAAHASGARPLTRQATHIAGEQSAKDTDNVQQGDQTTPDSSAKARIIGSSGSGESIGEGDQGETDGTSDGPGGHQDPAGDVNHECTGDCQE